MITTGLSGLGGIVSYLLHWGTSYAPVGNLGQAGILTGAGLLTAIGTTMWASERAGAGIAGGTIALVAGRLHAQMTLGRAIKRNGATTAPEGQAAGVYGRVMGNPHRQAYMGGSGQVAAFTGSLPAGAGVVVPRAAMGHEAGAMMSRTGRVMPAPAISSARHGFHGSQSFRQPEPSRGMEAGASRYVSNQIRWFGPRSWAYEAGKVYRSAHDVRR